MIPLTLACSMCSTAGADSLLPPIGLWCAIALGWMLSTTALGCWQKTRVPAHPGVVGTLVILVALVLIAGYGFGFGVGLFFFAAPAAAFAAAMIRSPEQYGCTVLRRRVRWLGACALIAVAIATTMAVKIRTTRTAGEYIVQWWGTVPARSALKELGGRPDGLPDYRFILENGTEYAAVAVAKHVAELGEKADLIALRATEERADRDGWTQSSRDALREATGQLEQRLEYPERSNTTASRAVPRPGDAKEEGPP